jgi:hypothetical protein
MGNNLHLAVQDRLDLDKISQGYTWSSCGIEVSQNSIFGLNPARVVPAPSKIQQFVKIYALKSYALVKV